MTPICRHSRRPCAGYTLIELLLVLVILATLGSVAMAQAVRSTGQVDQVGLVTTLTRVRQALELYNAQHGTYPARNVVAQLTLPTTSAGNLTAPDQGGRTYGPYIRDFPMNPVTGSSHVLVVDELPVHPTGHQGWVYVQTTGELRLNQVGRTEQGTPYYQL